MSGAGFGSAGVPPAILFYLRAAQNRRRDAGTTKSSSGQWLAFGFLAKGDEGESKDKGQRDHGHGNSEGLKVADYRSHQERKASREEASQIGDEREGAGAAFRPILLGK